MAGLRCCSPSWTAGPTGLKTDRRVFAMTEVWTRVAVLGAAAILLPLGLEAQTGNDPNQNPAGQMTPTIPGPIQPGPVSPTGVQQQQQQTMRDTLGAPGLTGQQMKDKQFLMKATEGGMAEVQLGTLATQKGGPEVKEFGQKMVDDHT